MPWYVVYTKPRNEKKTTQLLTEKNIEVYCPLTETVKQWTDRKKKVQEPLFKSYIFVCLGNYKEEINEVLETPGAIRALWWQGKPGIVRDEEILAIKDFLNRYKGSKISTELKPGQHVQIIEGPLKDQKGKLLKLKGNKAVLQLRSLHWNVIAEIAVQALDAEDS